MGKLATTYGIPRRGMSTPIRTTGATTRTAEGAKGFERDVKSALFLLAVTNMVGEQTFYETGPDRDMRFVNLIHEAVAEDPFWVARLIPWLRTSANMRTASIVAAAEYARAVAAMSPEKRPSTYPTVRSVVDSALQRPDEPGEFISYYLAGRTSKMLPGGVGRGLADAVVRLYDERAALKYDGTNQPMRMGYVLELTHPTYKAPWQADLFKFLVDRIHDHAGTPPDSLPMLCARAELDAIPQDERAAFLKTAPSGALAAAGMTWESLAGWLGGPMDKTTWEAMIPSMGLMALARNLRNFDQAGVGDETAALVAARLNDPEQVRKSRMFPLRFLSAYKAAPSDRWKWPLEQAVRHSLASVPELSGRTLILIDCSGSMENTLSGKSELRRCEAATLFGLALAKRAEHATVIRYGDGFQEVPLTTGANLLREVASVGAPNMGGTDTWGVLQATYIPGFHNRIILLTDEQVGGGYYGYYRTGPEILNRVKVPVITFNLAGYSTAQMESGTNRITVGGLSDAGFQMISLLDKRKDGVWPF